MRLSSSAILLLSIAIAGVGCSRECRSGKQEDLGSAIAELARRERADIGFAYLDSVIDAGIVIPGDLRAAPSELALPVADDALERLSLANFVLVGDRHSNPIIGSRTAWLLDRVAGCSDGNRPIVFLVEAIPHSQQNRLSAAEDAMKSGSRREMLELLAFYVPSPIGGLMEIAGVCARRGIRLIACAVEEGHEAVPADVPDDDRSVLHPRSTWIGPRRSEGGASRDELVNSASTGAIEIVASLLTDTSRRRTQVWAMFGRAHLFGPKGMEAQATRRAWSTVVVLPSVPMIDEVLWRRGGWNALAGFYWIQAGVLRPPAVSADEFRRMLAVEKRQADTSRAR